MVRLGWIVFDTCFWISGSSYPTSPLAARHTHKKQSGGSGQFAKVVVKFEPLNEEDEATTGFIFDQEIKGGAVPKESAAGYIVAHFFTTCTFFLSMLNFPGGGWDVPGPLDRRTYYQLANAFSSDAYTLPCAPFPISDLSNPARGTSPASRKALGP